MMKEAVFAGLLGRGVYVTDCGLASTPAMFMSIIFEDTAMDVHHDHGQPLAVQSKRLTPYQGRRP